MIADLGVNSNQLDDPKRGFSFQKDGPLDMRMNPFLEVDAEKLIEALNEKDLANLIYKYGDERLSRKIARRIKTDLIKQGSYDGTKALAYAVWSGYKTPSKINDSYYLMSYIGTQSDKLE